MRLAAKHALELRGAEGSRMQRNSKRWIVLAVLGCALGAINSCGGDDDDADSGTTKGEPCASPGYTMTGCSCKTGAFGKRTCGDDAIWTACTCPPITEMCVEGQDIRCNPCSGETEGRLTKCLQAGTFDCACDNTARAGRGGQRDAGN